MAKDWRDQRYICKPLVDGIHVIPVPRGWSPEVAWEAIKRRDVLTDPDPSWVNVRVKSGKFVELCDAR